VSCSPSYLVRVRARARVSVRFRVRVRVRLRVRVREGVRVSAVVPRERAHVRVQQ